MEESGGKWGMEHFLWGLRNVKPQTFYPDIPDMGVSYTRYPGLSSPKYRPKNVEKHNKKVKMKNSWKGGSKKAKIIGALIISYQILI